MIDRNDAAEQLVKLVEAKASPEEYMCLALNFILGALYDIRDQNEKMRELLMPSRSERESDGRMKEIIRAWQRSQENG